jgi:hypothetical protein
MSSSASVWLVLLVALCAANSPFFTERLMLVAALPFPKTLGVRLAELLVCYFLVGGVGLWLEKQAGQIAPQGWEFYAITAALFLTLAFPGFVFRYLFKRHA